MQTISAEEYDARLAALSPEQLRRLRAAGKILLIVSALEAPMREYTLAQLRGDSSLDERMADLFIRTIEVLLNLGAKLGFVIQADSLESRPEGEPLQ